MQTADENDFGENVWGCGALPDDTFVDYPHFKRQLMHPCHHGGGKCCNGTVHAPFALRLTSFFHADQAGLLISYDAFPVCGDGFDFLVRILSSTQGWFCNASSADVYLQD